MHISNVNENIPLRTYNWNLSQVNILIGPNGSGKLLILKDIKEQHTFYHYNDDFDILFDYIPSREHSILKDLLDKKASNYISYGQVCLYDILRRVNYLKDTQLLVLDNIKIDLDIDTQKRLITWILEIYPSLQLIISSHFPCVVAK
jgi:predicted ATP-binding protein involved in virulence